MHHESAGATPGDTDPNAAGVLVRRTIEARILAPVLELEPSDQLSKNEIEAAKLVRFVDYNPQSQPKIEWPAAFVVVRSYLDQLVRGQGLAADRTSAIGTALDAAEAQSGKARKDALNKLAKDVDKDAATAKDGERVKAMSDAIKKLAKETK